MGVVGGTFCPGVSWSGKDIRIILEDDSGLIQGDTACIMIYNASILNL